MLIRQEQRAHELAAFKQKTQKLFESFEVKGANADVPETSAASLLDSYSIDLSISNVGVAFPLIHDDQLNLPKHGSHDGNSVRAFLFSIASIQFGTVRGVTGEASMKRFSFQFVHRYPSLLIDFLLLIIVLDLDSRSRQTFLVKLTKRATALCTRK